jgi:hypothetical protein
LVNGTVTQNTRLKEDDNPIVISGVSRDQLLEAWRGSVVYGDSYALGQPGSPRRDFDDERASGRNIPQEWLGEIYPGGPFYSVLKVCFEYYVLEVRP